ncbi:hypothetical protein BT96DRAFT_574164 [Gymnopus androsaceus JB14]|uniref:Uncharacterized protein n=1 Tax=Gymnopus androsaceus JB14 TaxID=1447944 RepID=A0A6A4HYH0_9AGAR|nr:hypothetical protein BT96DRAFT_574164 [Gymnopus androsaceus JB14]
MNMGLRWLVLLLGLWSTILNGPAEKVLGSESDMSITQCMLDRMFKRSALALCELPSKFPIKFLWYCLLTNMVNASQRSSSWHIYPEAEERWYFTSWRNVGLFIWVLYGSHLVTMASEFTKYSNF